MAGYRPKSLDELNSLYDKSINAKNEIYKKTSDLENNRERYIPSVASEEPEQENKLEQAANEEITGLVDDFIKSFGTPVAAKKVRPAVVPTSAIKPVASAKTNEAKAPVKEKLPERTASVPTAPVVERPKLIRSTERNDLFEDYKKVMDDDGEEEYSRFRKVRRRGKRLFEKKAAVVEEAPEVSEEVQPEAEADAYQQNDEGSVAQEDFQEASYENSYDNLAEDIAQEIPETLENIDAVIEKVLGRPLEDIVAQAEEDYGVISEESELQNEELADEQADEEAETDYDEAAEEMTEEADVAAAAYEEEVSETYEDKSEEPEVPEEEAEPAIEIPDAEELNKIIAGLYDPEEEDDCIEDDVQLPDIHYYDEPSPEDIKELDEIIFMPAKIVIGEDVRSEEDVMPEPAVQEEAYGEPDEDTAQEIPEAYEEDEVSEDMFELAYIYSDERADNNPDEDYEYDEQYAEDTADYEKPEKSLAVKNVMLVLLMLVLLLATAVSAVKAFVGVNADKAFADKYHLYSAQSDYAPADIKKGDLVVVSHEGIREGDIFAYKKSEGKYAFAKLDSVLNEDSVVADEGGQKTIVFKSSLRGVFVKAYPAVGSIAAFVSSQYIYIIIALAIVAVILLVAVVLTSVKKKRYAQHAQEVYYEDSDATEDENARSEYEDIEDDFRYLIQEDGGDDFDLYRNESSEENDEDALPVYQDDDYKYEPDEYVRN